MARKLGMWFFSVFFWVLISAPIQSSLLIETAVPSPPSPRVSTSFKTFPGCLGRVVQSWVKITQG